MAKRRAAERLAARRAAQVREVTAAFARCDPEVSEAQIAALLDRVAPHGVSRNPLAEYVIAHSEVLSAGGSRMPKVVAALLYAAIEAGVAGLVSPSCAVCQRPKVLFHTHTEGQRKCAECYERAHTDGCAGCGRDRPIKGRTDDGDPLCSSCQGATRQGICADCGRLKPLKRSTIDQLRYCRGCRARRAPLEVCSRCNRRMRVNARTATGEAICGGCYDKTRVSVEACDQCGHIKPLLARAGGKGGHSRNLCRSCYRNPKRECGICGRTRRVSLTAHEGQPNICPTCYQAPVIDCSVCGRSELGRRTTNHGEPLCFRCDATAKIDAILTDNTGAIPARLQGVRDAIVATDRPRSILSNMTRTASLTLLADIAHGQIELSHEALDQHGNSFGVNYLRSLLVATGALPPRDDNLARLRRFATDLLDTMANTPDRALLARYARWHVIGRAKRDRHGQLASNVAYRCRDDIRAAQRFLAHLERHGETTTTCTQTTLDSWISTTGHRTFIRWLQRNGHLAQLMLPEPPPTKSPGAFTAEDERWATVRHMLHDPTSASTEDRAAACLVLLYAQPAAKIAQLTTDDISTDATSNTYLRLGPEPLLLIPPLDALITALPVAKPFGTARTLADRRWLFPGKRAGQHIHSASMMRRLNLLGITTRVSRNTALLDLAATTPPAVFATLIGIHVGTAVAWAELAGGNWMTYSAVRRANKT